MRIVPSRIVVAAPLLLLGGCILASDVPPGFDGSVEVATHYVHRGMVENERGVLQAEAATTLPTIFDGDLRLSTWGNLDLSDQTGNAWMPPDHGGKFTEIDLTASYSQQFAGFDVTGGVQNYILPDGLEFRNGERGATTEVFARVGRETIWGLYPQLELRVDWDEADGWYGRGSVERDFTFEFDPKLHAVIEVGQGYSQRDESDWNYGIEKSGLADLTGRATLLYDWDDHTTFHLTAAASRLVDPEIARWTRDIGIDDTPMWLAVGATVRLK